MNEPRLKEAPADVRDVFATARAALDGEKVTGEFTPDGAAAVKEMIELRERLGWA